MRRWAILAVLLHVTASWAQQPWKFLQLVPGVSTEQQVKELFGLPKEVFRHTFTDGYRVELWSYPIPEPGVNYVRVNMDEFRRVDSVWAELAKPLSDSDLRKLFGAPRLEDGGPFPHHPRYWFYVSGDGGFQIMWFENVAGRGFDLLRLTKCTAPEPERGCRAPDRF